MASIIFYGAGRNAKENYERFVKKVGKPVCFVDNDLTKQGTMFAKGEPILSLEKAIELYPDFELHLTQLPHKLFSVRKILIDNGIAENRIHFLENVRTRTCNCWFPPGHFYSPIPNIGEISQNESNIFIADAQTDDYGIKFNVDEQLQLLSEFHRYQAEQPFSDIKKDGLRYSFDNTQFGSHMDAMALYSFLRHYKPKRVIEVGSGFSSCLMLDVNQQFLDNQIKLTFIEPHPDRLLENVLPSDNYVLIEKNVQDVDIEVFDDLEEGDILFIDSSHVSKAGSDVNHLYFKVLPRIKNGVLIQIHDIFYPFEYPKTWIYNGRAWNELYLLRGILTGSDLYEIIFFNSFLMKKFQDDIREYMPIACNSLSPITSVDTYGRGGSIWLRKAK